MRPRNATAVILGLLLMGCGADPSVKSNTASPEAPRRRGVVLADLTWVEAEKFLTKDAIVVLPLGAAAKEHGPHLRLDNDLRLADGLRDRVLQTEDVVVAPTLPYHFYPAFVEYPGSTTLRADTARDVIVDIVTSLAAHGPRKFYVLNTGVSTVAPLAAAKEVLAGAGISLAYTNLLAALGPHEKTILQQPAGTHADEGETSMMLVLAPERVDMSKAARDIHEKRPGPLTRDPNAGRGLYSPSGVYGDATLATRDKGEALVRVLVDAIRADLAALRAEAPLSSAK